MVSEQVGLVTVPAGPDLTMHPLLGPAGRVTMRTWRRQAADTKPHGSRAAASQVQAATSRGQLPSSWPLGGGGAREAGGHLFTHACLLLGTCACNEGVD